MRLLKLIWTSKHVQPTRLRHLGWSWLISSASSTWYSVTIKTLSPCLTNRLSSWVVKSFNDGAMYLCWHLLLYWLTWAKSYPARILGQSPGVPTSLWSGHGFTKPVRFRTSNLNQLKMKILPFIIIFMQETFMQNSRFYEVNSPPQIWIQPRVTS